MPQVGDVVCVHGLCDAASFDPHGDSTTRKFIGKIGRVVAIKPKGLDVGESPGDPAFLVRVRKLGTDLFWREELTHVVAAT